MSNPKWEEIIIAAPNASLFAKGAWEGLLVPNSAATTRIMDHILKILDRECVHIRRGGGYKDTEAKENNAEINYDLKQPIPYGIITSDDNDIEGIRVFVYERLTGGTEERLHNSLSIGVGGHMNVLPKDIPFMNIVKEEAARELEEELIFDSASGEVNPSIYPVNVIGLLNDNANDVGRVHLGILYTVETPPTHSVKVRETDTLKGEWMTLDELEEVRGQLESWSSIALDALKEIYA